MQLRAALLTKEKEKLDLEYQLLIRDIYESAEVKRSDYSIDLTKGKLEKLKQPEKPNADK